MRATTLSARAAKAPTSVGVVRRRRAPVCAASNSSGEAKTQGKIYTESPYTDPYYTETGKVRGRRAGRRASATLLYESLASRTRPLDVLAARLEGSETEPSAVQPRTLPPVPCLLRAVESRAGCAVEEDEESAKSHALESARDERTFAPQSAGLASTLSEGALEHARRLLEIATEHSREHGEVLRCCLPMDALERSRFRLMELALLRSALAELETKAPASVVIHEACMMARDFCDAGMLVPVRRVLTNYIAETTRHGDDGWGLHKAKAPWDDSPEMLLNPKRDGASSPSDEAGVVVTVRDESEGRASANVADEGGGGDWQEPFDARPLSPRESANVESVLAEYAQLAKKGAGGGGGGRGGEASAGPSEARRFIA